MKTLTTLLLAFMACSAVSTPLEFLVMGDWGGSGSSPYTTKPEIATAAAMGNQAQTDKINFALALGDNFYTEGVKNVDDARFRVTFEEVFTAPALQSETGFQFHVLAGNHDHRGNVTAQVAYSARSDRWNFPSLYYTFTETIPGTQMTVQFVMIDTVLLSGNSDVQDEDGHIIEELRGSDLPGPACSSAADAQWEWITSTLENSTADYLIVNGHYPVYSICEHGPTTNLVHTLRPLLEKHKVSAYLNGHDHCMEHISYNGVQYHTIGSAHENDPSTAHTSKVPKDSLKFHCGDKCFGGYGKITADQSGLLIQHYDGAKGALKYEAPLVAPRQ